MSQLHRKIKRRYFTLVELVAAMAVMVFVALIIGSASLTFYNALVRSQRLSDRLKVCQSIDRIMDNCLRNAVPFTWKDENGELRIIFEGKSDTLLFACPKRYFQGEQGGFLFIRLKVDEQNRLIAQYSSYPRPQWMEEENQQYPVTEEVLALQVDNLSFLYAEMEDDEVVWNEEWEELTSTKEVADTTDVLKIPLAVQMTVIWKDGSVERWLRRTAGSARNTRYGGGDRTLTPSTATRQNGGRQ